MTTSTFRRPTHEQARRDLDVGDRFIGPSGSIWTLTAFTSRGDRIVLQRPTAEGPAAIVVDRYAVERMVPADSASPDRAQSPSVISSQ